MLREAPRRNSVIYVISTTMEQDLLAVASLTVMGQRELGYSRATVRHRSNAALDAAGIRSPWWTPGLSGNIPGVAGARARAAGAMIFFIPSGTTGFPPALLQFEPAPVGDFPYEGLVLAGSGAG